MNRYYEILSTFKYFFDDLSFVEEIQEIIYFMGNC